MLDRKKGQLVTGIIGGIIGLVILVIVGFLIIDTLNGADLISQTDTVSLTNATVATTVNATGSYVNAAVAAYPGVVCSVTACRNATSGTTIPTANWTATNCLVTYTNTSADVLGFYNKAWKCDYSYNWDGSQQVSVDGMIRNYTKGVDNVSAKIPTILLVAAVVLLFGAIVVLVGRSKQVTETTSGGGL